MFKIVGQRIKYAYAAQTKLKVNQHKTLIKDSQLANVKCKVLLLTFTVQTMCEIEKITSNRLHSEC